MPENNSDRIKDEEKYEELRGQGIVQQLAIRYGDRLPLDLTRNHEK